MKEILERYDDEVRAKPVGTPYLKVVQDNYVTRLEGAYNFICFWNFSDSETQKVISKQARYFREQGKELMWRVYDHDKPSNIEKYLQQEGFMPKPKGTFMALLLDQKVSYEVRHDIKRVTTPKALQGYLSVADTAFGSSDESNDLDYFKSLLINPDYALFSGYVDHTPVASGLIQFSADASFGLLFAGSVLPAHRRKGFYRALVMARAAHACQKGCKYLTTEAYDTSRPILEKLGFISLGKETTWVLPARATA